MTNSPPCQPEVYSTDLYRSELPEDLRLYDESNPVCRYYHITRREAVLRAIEAAVGRLSRATVAVDLGCGSGVYTRRLPSTFATRVGIDLATHKLAFARSANTSAPASYVAASLLDVPVTDACADFVLCTEVLEHFPDPHAVLREISRIVRPGAMLVMSSPGRLDLPALGSWLLGRPTGRSLALKRPDMHGHYWYFAPRHLASLLAAAGFKVVSMHAVPKLHFRGLPRLLRWGVIGDRFLSQLSRGVETSERFRSCGAFLVVEAQRNG